MSRQDYRWKFYERYHILPDEHALARFILLKGE